MKLISMTDFVLEQLEVKQSSSEFKESVKKYAEFLKQPLKLSMFITCENQKAKEKVIFEGFWLDETYKIESRQLPYLTNGKISVFLHSDFEIRHQLIQDLVDCGLECSVSF